MTRKIIRSSLAAFAAAACVPSLAAASTPVQLDSFTVNPSCVHPGGTVTAAVAIQDTTYYPQGFYGQGSVSAFGVTFERGSVLGPYFLPPYLTVPFSESQQVPYYTPYGYYTVSFGIGPNASSPTGWGSISDNVIVSPFC